MLKYKFAYSLGDLVKFYELINNSLETKTGIIIKQSFRYTTSDSFRIMSDDKNYWVDGDRLTLLSESKNKT